MEVKGPGVGGRERIVCGQDMAFDLYGFYGYFFQVISSVSIIVFIYLIYVISSMAISSVSLHIEFTEHQVFHF